MKFLLSIVIVMLAAPCVADLVVPTRTIRADAIISENDIRLDASTDPNGFERLRDVVGQEARNVLYAGRPILLDDIGPPAIVDRNQIVGMVFEGSGLRIVTGARALERGGVGDNVRVMNLASRATLIGQINADGTIQVVR